MGFRRREKSVGRFQMQTWFLLKNAVNVST